MLSSFLLILLATAAVATPLSNNDNHATIVERGDSAWWRKRSDLPARIKRCNNSPNCESYINSLGDWDLRFKRGMEPGSADYQRRFNGHSKREESSNVTTYLEIYDHSLTWGCDIHPAVTLGNLSIMCPKGEASCIGGPVNIPVQWMAPAPGEAGREPIPETMAITATGSYDPEFQGDFIQAIQAVAAAGAKWDKGQEWQASISKTKTKARRDTAPQDGPTSSMNAAGSCDLATLTSAINLDRFVTGNDNVQGFMHVAVTIPTLQSGFCAVTGDMGAASAIGGAIPGLGGVIGGVFGLISAACSLSNSAKPPAGT